MTDDELLATLDIHFYAAGCPSLSLSQLLQHRLTGSCRECRDEAAVQTERQEEKMMGAFDMAPGQ